MYHIETWTKTKNTDDMFVFVFQWPHVMISILQFSFPTLNDTVDSILSNNYNSHIKYSFRQVAAYSSVKVMQNTPTDRWLFNAVQQWYIKLLWELSVPLLHCIQLATALRDVYTSLF